MTTPTRARSQWRVPAALIALSLIPVVAGAFRTAELASGAPVTEANARFFASPAPVLLHIVGATVYCVVGAFQFVPSLRGRRWHRLSGRALVPFGLIAAGSGLWMSVGYPLPPSDGDLLVVFRLGFGLLMVVALVLGVAAARRRDFAVHAAWMARAYAVALGAGTQAFVLTGWAVLVDTPGQQEKALLMAFAWLLNLAVAERAIRRNRNNSDSVDGLSDSPRYLRRRPIGNSPESKSFDGE